MVNQGRERQSDEFQRYEINGIGHKNKCPRKTDMKTGDISQIVIGNQTNSLNVKGVEQNRYLFITNIR